MLEREEYVEQSHFFRVLSERITENRPLQDLLAATREELLATTKLPMAVDFLLAELKHSGGLASAMKRLGHYFTPFQTYVMSEAESERSRFDFRIAVAILREEATYRAGQPTPPGIFLYQFETLCRNRLRYDPGLEAIAGDPIFDEAWREWIFMVRRQIGLVDFADLLFIRSQHLQTQKRQKGDHSDPEKPLLFGEKEGRIALANRQKDPLYLFAALQRQLGYPVVPRPKPIDDTPSLIPQLRRRLERIEVRLKMMEEEQRVGSVDLTKFYERPGQPPLVSPPDDL